jgi:hypothetical protein
MVESSHFYEFIGLTCFFASILCRIELGKDLEYPENHSIHFEKENSFEVRILSDGRVVSLLRIQ